MPDVSDFFVSYRTIFESFDAASIAAFFAYPCHITSAGDPPQLSVAASQEEWTQQIAQLVELYRSFGVTTAETLSLDAVPLSDEVTQASVHWRLMKAGGAEVYRFHAIYTLARIEGDFKIAAIAHNELPRIFALLDPGAGYR